MPRPSLILPKPFSRFGTPWDVTCLTTYQKILFASIDRTLEASYARACHETRLGNATRGGWGLRFPGGDRLWIGHIDESAILVEPTD